MTPVVSPDSPLRQAVPPMSAGGGVASSVDPWATEVPVEELRGIFEKLQHRRWQAAARPAGDRTAKLRRLRTAILARRAAVVGALAADFAKHPDETELSEVQLVLAELGEAIRHVRRWMRPTRVGTPMFLLGTRSEIRYEPKGVVLILAAWNYPLALLINPLVAAVAAGNCVIVRPSEKVPHTNRVVREILADAFDEDEVAFVEGGPSTAEALLTLPFDHIFFTGSTRVGRRVMEAASRTLASVTLELGGKSPAIVDESADVRAAAERIVWGKFMSAGQACIAPDYAFVHRSRMSEFISASTETLARLYGPTEEARAQSADFARIVDAAGVERLIALIEDAVRYGAKVAAGGRGEPATRYLAPTILADVDPSSMIMANEIFGPVLPVMPFDSLDEVFGFVRSRGKPLAMYIFSTRQERTEEILANTSAGGTTVNNTMVHLANLRLPFGGTGQSGTGAYHGHFGFLAFSHQRAVTVQGPFSMQRNFYPPFGTRSGRFIRLVGLLRR